MHYELNWPALVGCNSVYEFVGLGLPWGWLPSGGVELVVEEAECFFAFHRIPGKKIAISEAELHFNVNAVGSVSLQFEFKIHLTTYRWNGCLKCVEEIMRALKYLSEKSPEWMVSTANCWRLDRTSRTPRMFSSLYFSRISWMTLPPIRLSTSWARKDTASNLAWTPWLYPGGRAESPKV